MTRLLDILAILLLALAVAALCGGVYLLGNRNDLGAVFLLVTGTIMLRSAVDLLRPRSLG